MKPLAILLVTIPLLAADCTTLASLKLPSTTITAAQTIAPGTFTPAASGRGPNPFSALPAFCRVTATLTPSPDSDIKIEVWLPNANWNGKFEAVGNGGWAGTISYPALATALARGYAAASTDTGHTTPGGAFAMNHPEKLADFGYRAVHEMTEQAKALIKAFYGTPAKQAYWNGCSTGGRQGLMSAQRYPADFDGIIAGAPANYMSHLQPWSLWVPMAVHQTEASYIPPAKYPVIHKAVLEACDALDGVRDGVLEDPTRCHFNPKTIECKGAETTSCLTPPQVEAARKIYSPMTNPRTGLKLFPALEPGSEMGWTGLAGAQPMAIPVDTFKYMVHANPDWDWKTIDFDKDVSAVEKLFAPVIDAVNPDLSPFFNRGGKLLIYHGWNDQLIAPRNSIDYFDNVRYTLGTARTLDAMRLYMVPGMGHCNGGDGTGTFDILGNLERWVEQGRAPDVIVASRNNPTRTRPLCQWPKVAVYSGGGSSDDASSFTCKVQ